MTNPRLQSGGISPYVRIPLCPYTLMSVYPYVRMPVCPYALVLVNR